MAYFRRHDIVYFSVEQIRDYFMFVLFLIKLWVYELNESSELKFSIGLSIDKYPQCDLFIVVVNVIIEMCNNIDIIFFSVEMLLM